MSNAATTGALNEIGAAVGVRASNADLAALFRDISGRTDRIDYDNSTLFLIFGAALLVLLALFVVPYSFLPSSLQRDAGILQATGAVAILTAVVTLGLLGRRWGRLREVQRRLQKLYEENILGLVEESVHPGRKAGALARFYREFRRGNHSRAVTALRSGTWKGESATFRYQLIDFEWVDKRVVEEHWVDSQGRPRSRRKTVYDKFFRTVLLSELGIGIEAYVQAYAGEHEGVAWETASLTFNRIYKVFGESEIALAKLLKPALVVLIEDLAAEFPETNFEFSRRGAVLISTSATGLLAAQNKLDITDPAAAAWLLTVKVPAPPRMRRLLEAVDQISRHAISELTRNAH